MSITPRLLAVSALLLLVSVVAHAQVSFPIAHPVVKVGDRWRFVSLDGYTKLPDAWQEETVREVGETITVSITTNAVTGELLTYDRDWNAIVDVKGKTVRQVKFDFPFEAGKEWESKYEWVNARGHHGRMDMRYRVRGAERITVPAGTFDTVVVEGKGSWHNMTAGGTGIAVEVRWYAPEAKRPVRRTWVTRFADGRHDQNRIYELTELEVKP